jgi:cytochrome c peroxidase
MFLTPTLRNTATRRAFFHNGVFQSLEQVLDFYNFRDTNGDAAAIWIVKPGSSVTGLATLDRPSKAGRP